MPGEKHPNSAVWVFIFSVKQSNVLITLTTNRRFDQIPTSELNLIISQVLNDKLLTIV